MVDQIQIIYKHVVNNKSGKEENNIFIKVRNKENGQEYDDLVDELYVSAIQNYIIQKWPVIAAKDITQGGKGKVENNFYKI